MNHGRVNQVALLNGLILNQVRHRFVGHPLPSQLFRKDRVKNAAVDPEDGLAMLLDKIIEQVIWSLNYTLVVELVQEFLDKLIEYHFSDLDTPLHKVCLFLIIVKVSRCGHIVRQASKEARFWIKYSLLLQVLHPVLELHHLTDGCLEWVTRALITTVVEVFIKVVSLVCHHGDGEWLLVQSLANRYLIEASIELESPLHRLASHNYVAGPTIGKECIS